MFKTFLKIWIYLGNNHRFVHGVYLRKVLASIDKEAKLQRSTLIGENAEKKYIYLVAVGREHNKRMTH